MGRQGACFTHSPPRGGHLGRFQFPAIMNESVTKSLYKSERWARKTDRTETVCARACVPRGCGEGNATEYPGTGRTCPSLPSTLAKSLGPLGGCTVSLSAGSGSLSCLLLVPGGPLPPPPPHRNTSSPDLLPSPGDPGARCPCQALPAGCLCWLVTSER